MRVDVNGQQVDFPDSMSEAEVISAIRSIEAGQQPPPEAAPQEDYMTRENLMSQQSMPQARMLEDALIGAGRFLSEAGQGIKQKYLMATGDEGEAQAYTDEVITPDRRRWEKGTEGAGMEDVGYYGSMMLPGMATGGAGVLGTAAIAGLEAGLMPTSEAEWQESFEQALIGAGFAGGLRALPEGNRIFQQWRKNRQLGKVDEDVLALAEQFGVKVPRSVNRPSAMGKIAEEGAHLPVVGRPGAAALKQDAAATLDEMSARTLGDETPQEAYIAGKEILEEADSAAWKATHAQIGDAPIDRQGLNKAMDEIRGSLQDTTIGRQQAQEVQSMWASMRQRPRFDTKGKTQADYDAFTSKWDEMDKVRGFTGDTLEDLHKFRAQFGAGNEAAWREKGWKTSTTRAVYQALSDELYSAAHRSYGQAGTDLLTKAVEGTKKLHRTQKSASVMKSVAKDTMDRQSTFISSALGTDKDKIQAMKIILGERGAPAVQREIIDNISNVFSTSGGEAAAKRIAKLNNSVEAFFGADEAAAMRGLGKFMNNIPKDKQGWMRNWIGGGAVMTAAVTNPLKVGAGGAAIYQWTKRQDVVAMLQKLETAAADSPLYKALTNSLTESAMIAGGVAGAEGVGDPLEIEIRNGIAQ